MTSHESTTAPKERHDEEIEPARHASPKNHAAGEAAVHRIATVAHEKIGEAEALLARHGLLIHAEAQALGIEPAVAAAIVLVESNGGGFVNNRLVIRFEPSIFKKRTGHHVADDHKGQDAEYAAFAKAKALDSEAAYESISMGAGQVMGFNAKDLDFKSAADMMKSFEQSEANQLSTMLRFIGDNATLVRAAKAHNWTSFARHYNGGADSRYGAKLKKAFTEAETALAHTKPA